MFEQTGLEVLDVRQPLGRVDETLEWVKETAVALG